MKVYQNTIIAEKTSQLKAYLSVVSPNDVEKITPFHYVIAPCKVFPNGANAVSCRGFLMALLDPAEYKGLERLKNWNIEDVPFPIPRPYIFAPGKGKGIREQLEHIKNVLRTSVNQYGIENVTVVTATDIDESGAAIAEQVYLYSFSPSEWVKVNKKALHINSLEKTDVFKGFMHLNGYEHTARMAQSSLAKQCSDWATGLGLTRVVTILAKQKVTEAIERLNNGSALLYPMGVAKQTININAEDIFPKGSAARMGRVSHPTLHFIFNRENEILNFKPKDFYEINANFTTPQGSYKGKLPKFKTFDPNEVSQLFAQHGIQNGGTYAGIVSDIKTERKKKSAPLLHSLTSLQALANRKWKMSAKQVLDAVQQLYEAKITTYPRTSCRLITTSVFQYLNENVEKYKQALNMPFDNAYTAPRNRFVNNESVEEHHAIVLTRNVPTLEQINTLPEGQRNLYLEIARTTLGMFAPDYEYDQTTITTTVNNLPFVSVGKIERVRGFESLWDKEVTATKTTQKKAADDEEENQSLPPLTPNQQVQGQVNVKTGTTQPPQRYTEAALLEAMESAGKFVENEEERAILKEVKGIGTPATRADIIASIKDAKYVEVEKNHLFPTPKAMLVCRMTQGTMLSNPETTAKWEMYLKNISQGKGNANAETFIERNIQFIQHFKDTFIHRIDEPDIKKYVEAVVIQANTSAVQSRIVCPKCKNGEIKAHQSKDKKSTFFSCSSYNTENACGFSMSSTFFENKLTKTQLVQLLTKGITKAEVKLKSRAGKEYKAKIRLNPDTFKMEQVFDQSKKPKTQKSK